MIKRFEPHLSWWVSERDSGQAAAINKGFQRSSGDIMAWINSDDLIAPGALAQVVTHLKDWSAPQVVYGNRIVIDEEGLEVGRWVLPYHSSQILRWVDFVPQETMYWTRSAWELAGSEIDESLGFAIDWEFLLRLSHRGTRFVHLPYFTGLFRVHGDQKTSSQISSKGWEEMGRLRLQELGRVPHQWEILGRISPFLLAARCLEIKLALIGIAAGKGRLRIS
ncbi:glycosyltransferase involved in cell wall biosynthesis [Rhizobium mesoamericanum]|nr:glycosyltransferase involved in cell wall biosynthesis [Rhizobium mesoamericanum]